MAGAGYDCLTIDLQHGLIEYSAMLAMLQAMSGSHAAPVVRVTELNAGQIGRVLDAGAQALICPLVNTREQAEMLVRAVKYPPAGVRSFGPVRAAMHAGMGPYFGRANIDIATLAMVEPAQAMENLEDIVSVPGLDGIYIGPADLSIGLGLGLPGPELHPELAAAMERVRNACERHGKVAAVHQVPGIAPSALAAQGFGFVTSGSDVEFLRTGAVRAVQVARPGA